MSFTFISLFAGIEAATVAWKPLGFRAIAYAEIDPFASALLAHRFPSTPNVGDVTKHDWTQYRGKVDGVVGGPPCQAFSVAGLRRSLSDARGNLSLEYVKVIHAIDPIFSVTENVPGWLNTKDNAFGCFLAGLVGEEQPLVCSNNSWPDAGMVVGPRRTAAWRILDAQYQFLAQRRRRVFVVSFRTGDGQNPGAVLFEPESVPRNTPPGREAGANIASSLPCGLGSGGADAARAQANWLIPEERIAPTLDAAFASKWGLDDQHINSGAGLFVASPIFTSDGQANAAFSKDIALTLNSTNEQPYIAHSLCGEGFDASEDGTGRGTPLVPVAFTCKDYGGDAGEISPTLRAMEFGDTHANGGGQVAVCFAQNTRDEVRLIGGDGQITGALAAEAGMKQQNYVAIELDTLNQQGMIQNYASTQETHTGTLLLRLRKQVGEEAFAEWGLGILDSFQQAEVLQSNLFCDGKQRAEKTRPEVVGSAPEGTAYLPKGPMHEVRQAGRNRHRPHQWGLERSDADQLTAYLSKLSQSEASAAEALHDLRQATEGLGILRHALSAVQDPRRPARREGEPTHAPYAVRRLTPKEAERLQGFPDNFTLIPYRKKFAADGPRYRALGNSMAVPVLRWIGERIQKLEATRA